jgi:enoyl-CoA hydratase
MEVSPPARCDAECLAILHAEKDVKVDYSEYRMLLVERTRNVLRITLNRPDELNALNQPLHHELSTVFVDAGVDKEVDVVVLAGAGRAFSAGGDWNWMRQQIADRSVIGAILPDSKRMMFSILDCEKPIICRVNGDAIGAPAARSRCSAIS